MESILKNTIINVIVKRVMEEAVKRAAFLAIGPINSFVTWLLTKFVTHIVELGIVELSIVINGLRVDSEVKEINEIVKKLSRAQSDKEVIKYEKELEIASYKFISFNT